MSIGLRRLALLVEYDGTSFAGSQLQSNGPSIQAELERAIEEMTRSFARVAFAGRTDAGVHALGQVACFDTQAGYNCEAFVGGLNVRLPDAIAVRSARDVEQDFDPRRRAISRRYRYSLVHSMTRVPLQRWRAWQVPSRLDVEQMRAVGRRLLGEQDFAAFASPEAGGGSTRRRIETVCIRQRGREITVDIEANAFLMHQVRRTVAALVGVGRGRLRIEAFEQHLREARPGSYERAAPPYGLCLIGVRYEPPLFAEEREL
ncbi:MAG TPA: tRNA pseudouridine(38-40) synthase TruA [Dehalococcoidia bacterium]|nr:tRNA pseudouridine(38-40) synthase TruA [Dehalococcoidia bacterium]